MTQQPYSDSEVLQVETAKIKDNPLNRLIYNPLEDPAFLASIREQGILEPLVLRPDYVVVSLV